MADHLDKGRKEGHEMTKPPDCGGFVLMTRWLGKVLLFVFVVNFFVFNIRNSI